MADLPAKPGAGHRRHGFVRGISAKGFWGTSGDRLAWIFSIGLVVMIVTNVGFQYGINVWNRAIFDAIEKRDSTTVFYLTAVFFPLAIGSVVPPRGAVSSSFVLDSESWRSTGGPRPEDDQQGA